MYALLKYVTSLSADCTIITWLLVQSVLPLIVESANDKYEYRVSVEYTVTAIKQDGGRVTVL
jgi:hypothetical protein